MRPSSYPRRQGDINVQIKKLEKKLKKVEKEFETAPALRQVRLLKSGKRITKRLDKLRRILNLLITD